MNECMYVCMHACLHDGLCVMEKAEYPGLSICLNYMCMYECMYVCMYACIRAVLFVRKKAEYPGLSICLNYMCICMYVCMYACMHACQFVRHGKRLNIQVCQSIACMWLLHVPVYAALCVIEKAEYPGLCVYMLYMYACMYVCMQKKS
jgi:hypothetical protein